MNNKDEITMKIVKTMLEFVRASGLQWDETYFRFVQQTDGSTSSEWLYRLGKSLDYFQVERDLKSRYQTMLEDFSIELFDAIFLEKNKKPLVAVASIDVERNYKIKFDYEDSRCLQISKLYVGRNNSYFNGEVEISANVKEYLEELQKKGVDEIPSLMGDEIRK